MTAASDPFSILPAEACLLILSQLEDPVDLVHCCKVSKLWNRYASDSTLWQKMFHTGQIPNQNGKQYIDQRAVGSISQLIQKIIKFASAIPLEENGSLKCLFAYDPCSNFEICIGDPRSKKKFDMTCLFMKKIDKLQSFGFRNSSYTILMSKPPPPELLRQIDQILNKRKKALLNSSYGIENFP